MIDSLTLPEAESSALAPPAAAWEPRWTVPEPVARRLCRILSPSSDQSTMPRPEEVTAVRLAGRVRSVEDGVARLSFEGTLSAAHTYEGKVSYAAARLTGVGRYDVDGRPAAVVPAGLRRHLPVGPALRQGPRTTAAAVEWRSLPRGPSRVTRLEPLRARLVTETEPF